ncbi:MAG: hypothetical protein QOE93_236 [Actinomycetota bacterium]|nr:hypothetical protein [Actinomycetota bacterium]
MNARNEVIPDGAAAADLVARLMADAQTISVPEVDQVRAVPGLGIDLHLAEYYRQLAAEQGSLHRAEGELAARPHAARAAELAPLATVPLTRLIALQAKADASTAQVTEMLAALAPFRTRPKGAVPRYYLFLVLLLGGDLAGMTGALISLGEVPWVAGVQALAVAAAAVVIGMLASEVKHVRDARRRMAAGLPEGEHPRGTSPGVLFQPDGGEAVVRWVLLGGLAAMLLIAGGVTALRSITDGAGWIFGCFAAAVTLGSAANSYVHSDEVTDLLDNLTRQHRRDDAELRRLDLGPVAEREREVALAVSVRDEWQARGDATAARVNAACALALVNNPAVAGHGPAPAPAAAAGVTVVPRSNGHGRMMAKSS